MNKQILNILESVCRKDENLLLLLAEMLNDEVFKKLILAFFDCLLEMPYKIKRKLKDHKFSITVKVEKEKQYGKK